MKRSVAFLILLTFVFAIVIGAIILYLPVSSTGSSINMSDAFFTAASAVTVTGLIVKDTEKDFSFIGKLTILVLLQLGGLGFMTFSTLLILLAGGSISTSKKALIENDYFSGRYKNVRDLIKKIFIYTISFEFVGAILFYLQFNIEDNSERAFTAVFHSISAFCNAGFSLFSNNLENYTSDIGINITTSILIIGGGIGFLVLNEVYLFIRREIKSFSKFSLHTKIVLVSSFILIVFGTLVIFLEETLSDHNTLSIGSTFLSSLFQSISTRTAGFNTIDLNILSSASIFIMMILMFIGASPGSTGGGVKTSTISVGFAYIKSLFLSKKKVTMFYRSISSEIIKKSFLVLFLSFLIVSVFFFILSSIETKNTEIQFYDLLFETISAFGTVGLSMGVTAKLSTASKLVLALLMFIGRVGPITFIIAFSRKESLGVYDYPEEDIMVG